MPSGLEDKLLIEELIGTYNQTLDEGRYGEYLDCWCANGVFEGLDGPYVGIEAIRAFTEAYDDRYRLPLRVRHFTVNIVSRIDGDRARSGSHLQLVSTGSKGVRILLAGRYEDELRRVEGRWRFSRRRLHQDMAAPTA